MPENIRLTGRFSPGKLQPIMPTSLPADPRMSIPEKIEGALDSIRPALQIDGGDVEFVDFNEDDGVVQIRLTGACGGCPISSVTVKQGIERRIKMVVPEVTEVAVVQLTL
jgi:Fe-S cluster biogenesis protein NfuA